MAIVTGDRYLEYLVRFVDRHTGQLLDGTLTLKLNPVGLHYVHSRLEALQELEGLLAGAPVDYLRAYVSDLGDHRALEQLRRILRLLTSLKVISVLPPPARDPTPLSLLPFGRLKVLELRGCDLSTSAARGLLELRHTLEKLICHNSTDALRHVFASRIVDIKDSPKWIRLSFVSCACNGLVVMDESLHLLPAVETLDLSRNQFAKVANLRKCAKLQNLDLGFNHLRSITSLSEVSSRLVKLVLRNNALTTLRGIENLKSVEGLDLSYNIISSFSELEILASLPCLQSLWLEGNPLCCARWYRAHVFSFFSNPEKLDLDENGISTREYWERQIILASRQTQPSGYGFYFPAKDEPTDYGGLDTKRKKYYRLASIVDDEQRKYSEALDQESVSCDSDNQWKDDKAISDSETEIVSLMNRVEYMKKEQSVLWLREFKEWMDQIPKGSIDRCQCTRFTLNPGKEKYVKQRKGLKIYGECSQCVPGKTQASEGASSSNMLESDMSFTNMCTGGHSNEYYNTNDGAILENSKVNCGHGSSNATRTVGVSSEQDQLHVHSGEPQNLSPMEIKADLHSASSVGGDREELKMVSAPLTAIDEIMGSRPPSTYPGSPPHYREDILQRRLYLEEEFLQLSAESQSLASSDSDTSCSDDDSCRFNASQNEPEHLLTQETLELDISDKMAALSHYDIHDGRRHEEPCLRDDTKSLSEYRAAPDPDAGKGLMPNHDKPLSDDSSTGVTGCCTDQYLSQDVGDIEKRSSIRKIKRRIVSLSENSVVCDRGPEFQKGNGVLGGGEDDLRDKEGQCSCSNTYGSDSFKAAMVLTQNNGIENLSTDLKTKTSSVNPDQDEFVKDFFHLKLADSEASETCQKVVHCECIYQVDSVLQQSEVTLLRSCKNKLYLLLIDTITDRQEVFPKVLGCHRLEELREVVVGLGLQALRLHMEGGLTYLFLPRSMENSKDLLCLLQVCNSPELSTGCSLQSWEQVQVKLLEKYICGSLKMGIVLYSMILFLHDKGESWVTRSMFVIEGCMLMCTENLAQFGYLTDDSESLSSYYSLDSCCPIQNILQMVIECDDRRCLTLTLDNATSGNVCFPDSSNICLTDKIKMANKREKRDTKVFTWKLKWFAEEPLLKFVAVLKAIHLGLTMSPLPVECIS